MFLESLKIVSGSWPIAAMVVVFFGAVMILSIVRRVSKSNIQRSEILAQKEIEIERFKRPQDAITHNPDARTYRDK